MKWIEILIIVGELIGTIILGWRLYKINKELKRVNRGEYEFYRTSNEEEVMEKLKEGWEVRTAYFDEVVYYVLERKVIYD